MLKMIFTYVRIKSESNKLNKEDRLIKIWIRKSYKTRRMMNSTRGYTTCDNLVNSVFKIGVTYNILLTDTTDLLLSISKDDETNEIKNYNINE